MGDNSSQGQWEHPRMCHSSLNSRQRGVGRTRAGQMCRLLKYASVIHWSTFPETLSFVRPREWRGEWEKLGPSSRGESEGEGTAVPTVSDSRKEIKGETQSDSMQGHPWRSWGKRMQGRETAKAHSESRLGNSET